MLDLHRPPRTVRRCSLLTSHPLRTKLPTPTLQHMPNTAVRWSCSQCDAILENKQPKHGACPAPAKWLCQLSGAAGLYKNYKRHAAHCVYCSPDRIREIAAAERSNKENRLTGTAKTESS